MESIFNKIDNLIDKIDTEFIKLYECAENLSEYEYFDFFNAIEQLIKLLKQYSLTENYNDKLVEYHHVMKDLFKTEAKTISHEIIDKNDNTKELTIKYITYCIDEVGLDEQIETLTINERVYSSLCQS